MLQWMGGSRRKVTTSRKSTQKRQKQYFEQRRRQQQCEAVSIENHTDDSVKHDHQKGNRSLDILSLLNVSKIAEECRPQFANATVTESMSTMPNKVTYARPVEAVNSAPCHPFPEAPFRRIMKSEGHVLSGDLHTSTSIPTIMHEKVTPIDCSQPTGTRTPSSHQMETISSESTWNNSSKVGGTESEYWKNGVSIQPSILDLIGDDEASGNSEENPVHEAHAAFSIEGLGKLGAETPVQSPQRPGRVRSGDQSSFTKAAKKLHSCKDFNGMLNDLDMEVSPSMQECLMLDTEKPSPGSHLESFPISGDVLYPFSCTDHNRSAVKDSKQLDGKRLEINSFFNEDRHDSFWNANSPSSSDVVYGKCGPNWKNDNAPSNTYFWGNDMPDFKFEGCHLPLRYPPHTCNDCPEADYSSPPHHMRSRNKRDNFTWLSEESCSSSAVRGEDIADMPSARCRRYAKDFQRPLMSNMKENYDEDMWNRMGSTMKGQEECNKSRKSARSKPHSKSAFFSPAIFSEDLVHDQDSWLLEEEFSLPNTTSSPGSFIKSSEKSQHRGEGLFGTDAQTELLGDSRCFLERSERDTPDEYSSENVAFSQPFCSRKSFNISKTSGQERWLGLQHDFGIHVQSSNSSEVADFFGEAESATTNPDLPAQGSVTKEEGDKPMSLPLVPENSAQISAGNKSLTPESRLPAGDTNLKGYSDPLPEHKNGVPDEMPAFSSEDMEEISSPRKILHESDGNFTSKKWQGSVPVLHQPKLKCTNIISVDDMVCFAGKDMDEENPNEPKAKTMSRESRSRESSCQMMMFQRCVQLLCVLKS